MNTQNILLLVCATFLLAAASEGPKPSLKPLPIEKKVLLEAPHMPGKIKTQVVSIAPVIRLNKKTDYEVAVTLPRSQDSSYTVLLYQRVAPPRTNCRAQLCWEVILSFSEFGSTQKQSLSQFSGDVLIVSWQRHLLGTPSSDEVNYLLGMGYPPNLEFRSGTRVVIDEAKNN